MNRFIFALLLLIAANPPMALAKEGQSFFCKTGYGSNEKHVATLTINPGRFLGTVTVMDHTYNALVSELGSHRHWDFGPENQFSVRVDQTGFAYYFDFSFEDDASASMLITCQDQTNQAQLNPGIENSHESRGNPATTTVSLSK